MFDEFVNSICRAILASHARPDRQQADRGARYRAYKRLEQAQIEYLKAYGWEYVGDDHYMPPRGYAFDRYPRRFGHAVNSQLCAARKGR